MRDNPVKHNIAAGGASFGAMLFEFFTPGLAQILKVAGCEFALFDMEHSGIDIETVKAQAAYCRGLGIVPMVRVPTLQYHFIARCLDAGMMGIMVPMVETAEQARAFVSYTQYPPHGVRGAGFGMAHDDYEGGTPADKMAMARRRTMVICLIETAKGAANVDKIAAVEGVDVVWLGHFDMTNFMGIPGQFKHPDFLANVDKIVAAARKHGKTAGFMAADDTWAREYFAKGFRLMAVGPDHSLFTQAVARGIGTLRAVAAEAAAAPAAVPEASAPEASAPEAPAKAKRKKKGD